MCATLALLLGVAAVIAGQSGKKNSAPAVGYDDTPVLPGQKWKVHDISRPRPRIVTPGTESRLPPSDAVVLFDGKDLSKWVASRKGETAAAGWKVENGYMEVAGGSGDLVSKEKFGDAQIHLEWAAPAEVKSSSQLRGNSGVLIMSRYEIQVLDTYDNITYADGGAGSIYGQWPPLVTPVLKPGEWQTYDIAFKAPKFDGGKLVTPAYVTVFLNGVLVHHHQEIIGRMAHRVVGTYAPHDPEEPFSLQDHGDKVRYRNIWIRRLRGYDQP